MNEPVEHFVDAQPYDKNANASGQQTIENPEFDAPTWILIWRRFKQHRVALVSALFLLLSYLMLPFVGFIAPYTANERNANHLYAPPQGISLFHQGSFIGPHVYPTTAKPDLENFRWQYRTDHDRPVKLEWFCSGAEHRFLGLVKTDKHLFCAPNGATVFLCLLYTSPSPRDATLSRMPSSA